MAEFALMSTDGFPLGLDWRENPESIPDGALAQAENCEYDYSDGSLKTVAGVKIILDVGMPIDAYTYDHRHKVWYFSSSAKLYRTDNITYTLLGSLTGAYKPVFCMYGDICLVASGGLLQAITGGTTLQTITGSPPVSHYVTSRIGRVLAFSLASDVLNYSSIGDYANWTNTSSDKSSGQFVNVGYKDPGNIIAIDFLSKVIMVYKEGGRAYKIIGEPQDNYFAVEAVSQTASCLSMYAALNVDNRAYYLGQAGFMSFTPTDDYGNIAPTETGLNINAWIAKNIDSSCQLWHVQSKKQIWVKTQNDKRVYLYHYIPRYSDGRGAVTVRTFEHQIADVCCVSDDVYIAYGSKIGILDDTIDIDDDKQIQTVVYGNNKLPSKRSILIMSKIFVCKNILPGYGALTIGKKQKQLTFALASPKIYGNKTKIYGNKTKIKSSSYTRYYKVGGGSNKSVQINLIVQKGSISIRQLDYTYLEV